MELKSSLSFVSARAFNAHAHLAPHAWRRLATVLKTHTTQSTEPLTLSRPARTETLSSTSFKQAACLSFSAAGARRRTASRQNYCCRRHSLPPPPSLTAACAPPPTTGTQPPPDCGARLLRSCCFFFLLIRLDLVPTTQDLMHRKLFPLHIVNVAILKIIVASMNYYAILCVFRCISL